MKDCLSPIISNWNSRGVLYGKPARECTPQQVAAEAWEQVKQAVNNTGDTVLTDDLIHSWNIDSGMTLNGGHLLSQDPLILPAVGERPYRPDVTTGILNLILAGDYLVGDWQVANMECASYNGRAPPTPSSPPADPTRHRRSPSGPTAPTACVLERRKGRLRLVMGARRR